MQRNVELQLACSAAQCISVHVARTLAKNTSTYDMFSSANSFDSIMEMWAQKEFVYVHARECACVRVHSNVQMSPRQRRLLQIPSLSVYQRAVCTCRQRHSVAFNTEHTSAYVQLDEQKRWVYGETGSNMEWYASSIETKLE